MTPAPLSPVFCALVDGDVGDRRTEQAFVFTTVDFSEDVPHPILLSRSEIEVVDEGRIALVVLHSVRSRRNLDSHPHSTLMAVDTESNVHVIRLRRAESVTVESETEQAVVALAVVDEEVSRRPTQVSGIEFEVTTDLAGAELWQRSRALLDAWKARA